jgi:type II secretory pathway pseudopilin PulG
MTVHRPPARAFSLVELVMVVATIAIVAAIAVPRMSGAATAAGFAAARANLRILQNAIDTYAAEHNELTPAHDPDGSVSTDADAFIKRLVAFSDDVGNPGSIYGPYLLRLPRNPANKLDTVRIDGAPAGAGLAGWRFDTARRRLAADHVTEIAMEVILAKTAKGEAVVAADFELGK